MERDAPLIVHLLGVGGITAIFITVGYVAVWLAGLIVDWWNDERG